MQVAEHPRTETIVCAMAVCVTGLFILFGTRDLPHRWVFVVLAWGWCAVRLLHLHHTCRVWRNWHNLATLRRSGKDAYRDSGIVVGSGFAWTAHHAAAIHSFIDRQGVLPTASCDRRGEGTPALHAVGQSRSAWVTIPWSDLSGHVCIEGATQSGKTYLLAWIAEQLIAPGNGRVRGPVVVLDPKGDADFVQVVRAAAASAGRPFALIRPYDHRHSASYDPLSSCVEPFEVRARVDALFPDTDDQFFKFGPLAALNRTAAMFRTLGRPYDLRELHRATMDVEERRWLLCRYLEALGVNWSGVQRERLPTMDLIKDKFAKSGIVDEIASFTLRELSQSPERFHQTMSNFDIAMSGLVDSSFTYRLTDEDALTWQAIDESNMVVVIQTDSLITQDVGRAIGKLVLQDLMGYLGHRFFAANPDDKPITLIVDEISEIVYPGFTEALNKAGGANGHFILGWQSDADLDAELGVHMAKRLRANLKTRITMQISDDETAWQLSRFSGEQSVPSVRSSSMSRRYGGRGSTATANVVAGDKPVRLIEPEWLTQLPRGEGFARIAGQRYKFLVPTIERSTDGEAHD
jgi:TraM recognition site of TraD and TraG